MKYVALLSGGKDSCFNLLHCKRNGHDIIAAATLSPHSGKDEIDSYMYQTVGQDGITLIAQALNVPLYRRIIQGQPVEQGSEYGVKSAGGGGIIGDETEDLYILLKEVLDHYPDIQAVSVGAILSNYQRVRVEHVCRRLSLTPLAYLWQRNQLSLLSEMISSNLTALLIKIAGAGLTTSHLSLSLSAMYPTLLSLHRAYGTHPCGEGGEYESFTVDCSLFRRRVEVRRWEVVVVDESKVAPVAYLRIKEAGLVEKDVGVLGEVDVPVPPLLEAPFERVRLGIELSIRDASAASDPKIQSEPPTLSDDLGPYVRKIGPWIAVGNVRLPSHPRPADIGEEVTTCFEILTGTLLPLQIPCANTHPTPQASSLPIHPILQTHPPFHQQPPYPSSSPRSTHPHSPPQTRPMRDILERPRLRGLAWGSEGLELG
ncbi:hypothetical protein HYDPIDRAFT_77552 [Hydnomerulius pinastri MD-312]|nr:hypothetical protein HYDPIDRAFT_77552 [Hydnomerulius pinastri MD-312]